MSMGFDVHSLLYTIASLSASFVAILGGFIASKLISIHGEREAIEAQKENISQELHVIKAEYDDAVQYMQEDDAIDFICNNISRIKNRESLEAVYEDDKDKILEIEELRGYWERAVYIFSRFLECRKPIHFNEDRVPKDIADEFIGNYFDYEVCKYVSRSSDSVLKYVDSLSDIEYKNTQYRKKKEYSEKLDFEIRILEVRRKQAIGRVEELASPKGMKAGLCIFACFSALNIILPLILSTAEIVTKYPVAFAYLSIFLLVIGLVSIFRYFVGMLTNTSKNEDSEHA